MKNNNSREIKFDNLLLALAIIFLAFGDKIGAIAFAIVVILWFAIEVISKVRK